MRLKEFIDKNGNKVTITKNTPSGNTSLGSFKERFEKLLEYTSRHKNPNTKNITTENLTDDTLEFTEHYDDGSTVSYEIYIGPLTEAWSFKVYTDGDFRHPIDHMSGMEWSELLKELRYYIVIPTAGSKEYQNILQEFLDKNGNKVSISNNTSSNSSTAAKTTKTNKDKFEELIKYIEDYQVPYIKKTETLRLNDISLLYKIYRKPPKVKEYTITLELHYSRFLDDWQFTIYKNDINIDDFTGKGWEELLKALRASEFGVYTIIPKPGTKGHDSLCEAAELQEFVDKNGKKVSIKNSSSKATGNIPDQTYRYHRLVAQIKSDGLFRKYAIEVLDERVLDIILGNGLHVKIERKAKFPPYSLTIGNREVSYNDYEDLLNDLVEEGIIANTDLCESYELKEFVDKYGNKVNLPRNSSSAPAVSKASNKDKFVKLIYHMMKDKLSCVTDVKCDRVNEDGFTYTEARSTNIGDYVLKLLVSYNKDNSWKYDLYIDTSLVETHEGTGMKELLWRLSSYFSVPFHKSAEYKDICESTSSIAADFKEYENLWD